VAVISESEPGRGSEKQLEAKDAVEDGIASEYSS